MRKLIAVLIILGGLWLLLELAAIPIGQRIIEQRVAERNRNAATVKADIDSFPLVAGLVFTGTIRELGITLDSVAQQNLSFTEMRFDLEGIELDRAALRRRQVRVVSIDSGTITATVDLGALSEAIGRLASLAGADVRVSGRTLRIGPASFELASDLLPCEPEAQLDSGRVIVSCTIDEVPESVLEAAQR